MFAGDTHANVKHWVYLFREAKKYDVKRIMQLGDFGYFPEYNSTIHYLDALEALCEQYGIEIWWIGGNHDDPVLENQKWHTIVTTSSTGNTITWKTGEERQSPLELGFGEDQTTSMMPIDNRPHVHYIPRGYRWEWDGVSYVAIGGAFSIDMDHRLEEEARGAPQLWFPDEMVTEGQMELASRGGRVDVVIAHDVPTEVDINAAFAAAGRRMIAIQEPHTETNRARLQQVLYATTPKRWIHGHWHLRYSQTIKAGGQWTKFEGIDCDGKQGKSYVIYGPDDLLHDYGLHA